MSVDPQHFLQLVRQPLEAGDATALAELVLKRWRPQELGVLLRHSAVDVRRVAAVTLGLVGNRSCVGCLSRALHDPDEQVNEMAEHGLWAIWFRSSKPEAAQPFREGMALVASEAYGEAIEKFQEAIRLDPEFAEAHNQCSIAHFFLGQWHDSLESCRKALSLVPTHFGAMAGVGHCYTHLGKLRKALECYRRALSLNPRMTAIARAVQRLESQLEQHASQSSYPGLDVSEIQERSRRW